jgi:hypothetical protein
MLATNSPACPYQILLSIGVPLCVPSCLHPSLYLTDSHSILLIAGTTSNNYDAQHATRLTRGYAYGTTHHIEEATSCFGSHKNNYSEALVIGLASSTNGPVRPPSYLALWPCGSSSTISRPLVLWAHDRSTINQVSLHHAAAIAFRTI